MVATTDQWSEGPVAALAGGEAGGALYAFGEGGEAAADFVADGLLVAQIPLFQHGEAVTALGRTRFAVHTLLPPYQLQRVVAFVREPAAPSSNDHERTTRQKERT